ncbi:hypothetical protein ASG25_15475 [Rhizobium sp. Leaf384]|uniref:phage portal protein n=1 Tax=Rhizobium sp. Leaf384 TaxID=1736358 RepID=UPI0007143A27|nr:phage portal protein [Rhizobium sp. Leaf384]KQS76820.1 hypothetical protein ASG25_15475 [Rhizobium sp. Leaf384]KQS78091.1 hypothetical protein ASG58_06695 [Rhizobium sp. Leaf383]
MGLFSAMLGGVRASSDSKAPPPADDDRWYDGGGVSSMSLAGRRVTEDGAMRVSAAYACIGLLSKTVATLPLRMYQRDPVTKKRSEAPSHPLNDLLEYQPNHWQSAWDFKAMMMGHLALRGNAYSEIVSGPRGFANSLEPIHPDRVHVERLADQSIRYLVADPIKGNRILLQDEVLHLRSHMAPSGLVGVSPVAYARETIGLALAAEEHGARLFSNGARPSGVVTVEKQMSDAAFGVSSRSGTLIFLGSATPARRRSWSRVPSSKASASIPKKRNFCKRGNSRSRKLRAGSMCRSSCCIT